ncbi:MAG: chemotaxis protein CheW, partial [Gemmatimonadaceae bacterium]
AGRRHAIALASAAEVLPARALTRYPGAPRSIAGLTNVRGTVVTVIDLGARLHEQSSNRPNGSILLVTYRGRPVGLAVDDVVDIYDRAAAHARGIEMLDVDLLLAGILAADDTASLEEL